MPKKENEVKEKKQKGSYFKDMKTELKKVVWPTPKELLNSTVSVLAFVVIITVIVFVLDLGFDALNKYGITRLQETIKTSLSPEEETEGEEEQTNTESNEAEVEATTENGTETETESESETEAEAEVENTTETTPAE